MPNTQSARSPLTRQELEIIKIVWNLKTATVRDVYETMREKRRIAYTTVMTMMRIMEGKGQLDKWQEGRAYVYKAKHPKERIIKEMVQEFVDRVFNGCPEPLVSQLIETCKIPSADRKKIKQMIQKKE